PFLRRVRAVSPITVDLAGLHTRYKHMPVMIGPLYAIDDSCRTFVVRVLEEQELHCGGVFGKHAEVRTTRDERGAERKALSAFDSASRGRVHVTLLESLLSTR